MTKVDEDKKHIIETMDRDIKLADEVKELSSSALKKLSFYLTDFANRKSNGDVLNALLLNQVPDKKDKKIISDLVSEFDNYDDDEAIAMVNGAGSSYKTSNKAFLLSLITVVVAKLLSDTNKTVKKYDEIENKAEVNYLFSDNGDLKGVVNYKKAKAMFKGAYEQTDDGLGSLSSSNYQAATFLISSTYVAAVNQIKKSQKIGDFINTIGGTGLLDVIVNKNDVNKTKTRLINKNVSGLFDKYDASVVRNYRTFSAKADSEFKRYIAMKYMIKQAIIVNELGPCINCLKYIGSVYSYDTACDLIPQHYCCRCEVKLLTSNNMDYDSDDN